jgi:hypothetical protein
MHFFNLNCNYPWLPRKAIYHLNMSVYHCWLYWYCDACTFVMSFTMFGSSLPQVVYRRAHVLFTLFVFLCAYWCPTHIVLCLCCFSSSCFQFLWIVHCFGSPLRYSLTFIYYIQFVEQWEEKGHVFVPHNNNKAKPCRVLNRQIC